MEYQKHPLTVPVDEFCRLIGVGRTKAFELIRLGEVDVVRLGRKTLVTSPSIIALLERNMIKGHQR